MELAIPGFEIRQILYRSPRTLVCRAIREKNPAPVVIKTLNEEYPSPQSIARLRREFQIIQKLDAPGVIRVYELVKFGVNQAMVMEDAGANSMDQIAGDGLPLEHFFKVAIETTSILGAVHEARVIHKDVNPANILWDVETATVKLVDFDLASELNRESHTPGDALRGSLPYMSPEQTGRMNRAVDYRSDYYSLGVTFYQLLTGALPFEARDSMGWIHSHITKTPPNPQMIAPAIPETLGRITLKLLAKNPEDRYQSSRGLLLDLGECREQWRSKGSIVNFHLARKDISETLQAPQKLYGREEEITTLMNAFDEAALGQSALMMVGGYAGVGKSSLVHEVYEQIIGRHGYFIEGKFEQFQENAPYSAIAYALRDLMRQILSESEERLAQWKAELLRALGPNGAVMMDLIPELERVVGRQPAVGALHSAEAKNRFMLVFRNFVRVFCQKEHPLVMFLDDLQWSDTSTLSLIENLIVSKEIKHLFIIGAYRNNEVNPSHPLMIALDEIQKSKAIYRLFLKPLNLAAVTQLIADTLHCGLKEAKPIAELAHQKTEGNPFFVRELLKDMHRQDVLRYFRDQGRWEWVAEKAERVEVSENVISLMIDRLKELPVETQDALKLAACIGSRFELKTLALIGERSADQAARALEPAIKASIVTAQAEGYRLAERAADPASGQPASFKFQHDQVRQAAYALIEDRQKERLHLRIGRLMMSVDAESFDASLIEIVRHLNASARLLDQPEEREQLARFNLRAAEKAVANAAFRSALQFLASGMALLSDDSWTRCYPLTFDLFKRSSECAYLCKEFTLAEEYSGILLERAQSPLERADVMSMRVYQYTALGRLEDAIAEGLRALALLEQGTPQRPGAVMILKELMLTRWRLGGRKAIALADLPDAEDPKIKLTIKIFSKLIPPAYLTNNEKLAVLCALKAVKLSVRHGLTAEGAAAFAAYATMLGNVFGELSEAFEFGKAALKISEREAGAADRCKTLFIYALYIHSWNQHWKTLSSYFKQSIAAGYQSGDMMYMAYACIQTALWNPELDLRASIRQLRKYLPVIRDTKNEEALAIARLAQQFMLNMRGKTHDRLSLGDPSFDETTTLVRLKQTRRLVGQAVYHIYKIQVFFAHEEYAAAKSSLDEADALARVLRGQPRSVELCFFGFLVLAALYPDLDYREQARAAKRMKKRMKAMKKWAVHCPANFLHLHLAMAAEWARLVGQPQAAADLYDHAIDAAKKNDYARYSALANELAGKWQLSQGEEEIGQVYLKEAHYFYRRWGALAKSAQLERSHPWLAEEAVAKHELAAARQQVDKDAAPGARATEDGLDLSAVTKASQTLSDEMVLEKLLKRLLDIVRESAGADKAVLLLQEKTELLVQAESAEDAEIRLMQSEPLEESDSASLAIVQYVARSKESVVLDDAAKDSRFLKDPYVQRHAPKSVLCAPIANRGNLVGILYLENNATARAFTADRLDVLAILASKAAISIENAQLYHQLEKRVLERTAQLEAAQREIVKAAHYSGMADIASGVLHNVGNILNSINTSVDVSLSMLHKSKMPSFQRANTLLRENEHRLGAFFDVDPRGKKLASFYAMLGDRLPQEHFSLRSELEKIQKCANLIKDVISTQQEYATAGLLTEKLDLSSIVEDALVLVTASFSRHSVRIDKNYDKTPPTPVQKSKLIHVLTNILKNAKESLSGKPPEERLIVIDVGCVPNACVFIRLADNGQGIHRRQLSKIFTHGFTTKRNGRGFGLHTCANYMTEMGGSIEVDSEGRGKGAVFTLKFPLAAEERR